MAMSIGLAKVAGYIRRHKYESFTYRPTIQTWIADVLADVEKTELYLQKRAIRKEKRKQRQLENLLLTIKSSSL